MENRERDSIIKKLFGALQDEMSAELRLSNAVSHPVEKGDNAEKSWVDWFEHYLPKRYKAAKAKVIDSKGHESKQIDIVLYDRQYSYLAFNKNGVLYIPSESVYAVFEVKQDLTKEHIKYAGESAASVRCLHRTSAPITYARGKYPPKQPHRIIAGILTTSSGWDNVYGNAFKKSINKQDELHQVDCGCVIDRGGFYYNHESGILHTSNEKESLVYFFLQLLVLLQDMGTVPAIDLKEYMKALSISEEQ